VYRFVHFLDLLPLRSELLERRLAELFGVRHDAQRPFLGASEGESERQRKSEKIERADQPETFGDRKI
jgi:hypothetical protein